MGKKRCMNAALSYRTVAFRSSWQRQYMSSRSHQYDNVRSEGALTPSRGFTSLTKHKSFLGILPVSAITKIRYLNVAVTVETPDHVHRNHSRRFSTTERSYMLPPGLKLLPGGISKPPVAVTKKGAVVKSHKEVVQLALQRRDKEESRMEAEAAQQQRETKQKAREAQKKAEEKARRQAVIKEGQEKFTELLRPLKEVIKRATADLCHWNGGTQEVISAMQAAADKARPRGLVEARGEECIRQLYKAPRDVSGLLARIEEQLSSLSDLYSRFTSYGANYLFQEELIFDLEDQQKLVAQLTAELSGTRLLKLAPGISPKGSIVRQFVVQRTEEEKKAILDSWNECWSSLKPVTDTQWRIKYRQQHMVMRETEPVFDSLKKESKAEEEKLDAEYELDRSAQLPVGCLMLRAKFQQVVIHLNAIVLDIRTLCKQWSEIRKNDDYTKMAQSQVVFWEWYAADIHAYKDAISTGGQRCRQLFKWNSDIDQEMAFAKIKISNYGAPLNMIIRHYNVARFALRAVDRGVAPTSPSVVSTQSPGQVILSSEWRQHVRDTVGMMGKICFWWAQPELDADFFKTTLLQEYLMTNKVMGPVEQSWHCRLPAQPRNFWQSSLLVLDSFGQLVNESTCDSVNGLKGMRKILDKMLPGCNKLKGVVFGRLKDLFPQPSLQQVSKETDGILGRRAQEKADLNQYIPYQKILALADVAGGPFTKKFEQLALKNGWQPGSGQSAVAAPRPLATTSHRNDSLDGAAAFDSQDAMTDWQGAYESLMINRMPNSKINWVIPEDFGFLADKGVEETFKEDKPTFVPSQNTQVRASAALKERERKRRRASAKEKALAKAGSGADGKTQTRVKRPKLPLAKDHSLAKERAIVKEIMRARARVPVMKVTAREFSVPKMEKDATSAAAAAMEDSFTTEPSDSIAKHLCHPPENTNEKENSLSATVGNAFKPTSRRQVAVFPAVSPTSILRLEESQAGCEDAEEDYVPLTYHIPKDKMTEALGAPRAAASAWWSYDKYRSATGDAVALHYCRAKQTSEKVAQLFLGKPVIGCDIEWKSSAKPDDSIKQNVSLIQVACEDRIALFHIALHKGNNIEDILAPTLKSILESPNVLKCGVAIQRDFSRMKKHLGIEVVSLFELSHLHRLVQFGAMKPHLVNRTFVSLAEQTKTHLGLPLYKGDERVSDWSQVLNMKQCKYAADDAYASYRVFETLKEKWHALDPKPPFPACAELGLPIQLATHPASESSESEEDVSIHTDSADEDINSLDEQLAALDIEDQDSNAASVDSYGENVFDYLTDEQLAQLERSAAATEIEDYTNDPLSKMSESWDVTSDNVKYPILPPEFDNEDSSRINFVGCLNLRPRFSISGSHHEAQERNEAPESARNVSEDLERVTLLELEEAAIEPAQDQDQPLGRLKDLSVQATLWAQEAQLRTKASSGKRKGTLTLAALRAYYLWEYQKLSPSEIANVLRNPPLKTATVAAYVAECLQFGNMEWSDGWRLQELVKELPRQAWGRYWRIRQIANDID